MVACSIFIGVDPTALVRSESGQDRSAPPRFRLLMGMRRRIEKHPDGVRCPEPSSIHPSSSLPTTPTPSTAENRSSSPTRLLHRFPPTGPLLVLLACLYRIISPPLLLKNFDMRSGLSQWRDSFLLAQPDIRSTLPSGDRELGRMAWPLGGGQGRAEFDEGKKGRRELNKSGRGVDRPVAHYITEQGCSRYSNGMSSSGGNSRQIHAPNQYPTCLVVPAVRQVSLIFHWH